MRENWRIKVSAIAGASALAFSALTATPALAEEPAGGLQEVEMPAGVMIVEGLAPDPGADLPSLEPEAETADAPSATQAAAKAAPTNTCLGATAAYGAKGCFQHNGDIVWAGDTKKDGMSAAVGVYTDYGRAAEVCINKLGVNTWATCDKDYRESGNVRLRVLRYDGDTGKFYQPESWSGWVPVDGKF
ncbi:MULTISPECIES: hypothetical protein [Streptomyces]|uniref:hypothetical protein n=1 Tax=Streptomyces TaxID=1883 RepID=UPI000D5244B8|nr:MULTISPECIES: hypothetical protein [Streptomyces]MXG27356.1 hypothetical protein [Streptomyces sp. YIM 132580]PVC67880.1 hypothetical protein DBP15_15990 [Streptomyces sp. CS065A]